jgi:predicted nucleic acid-binding protein
MLPVLNLFGMPRRKSCGIRPLPGDSMPRLAAQILTEFYAVVTDPRRFQPALTPGQAQREIRTYLFSTFKLILPRETTVTRMLNLLGSRSVRAGRIFDVFLAATMLDNWVQRIYTENLDDFQGIHGIEASNPFAT